MKMWMKWAAIILSSLWGMSSFGAQVRSSVVLVATGEQKLLYFKGLIKFSIGRPIVKAVRPPDPWVAREHLLIKGVKAGETDLWVWKRGGEIEKRTIRVVKMRSSHLPDALLQSVSLLQEVEVYFAGPGVVLRGQVNSLEEEKKISLAARSFPKQLRNDTYPSLKLLQLSKEWLETWAESLPERSVKNFEVSVKPPHLFAEFSLSDPRFRNQIQTKVESALDFAILEIDSPEDSAKTIYLRIHLIELQRSNFGSFGLEWPGSTEQAFVVSTRKIQNMAEFDLTLNLLETEGHARLLSSPEIVMRSPGQSELFAGGEIPITQKGRYSSRVTWKPHGLRLNLESKETTLDRVRIAISTEFSHLNYQNAIEKIPAIQINRVQTEVNAYFNEPLFLCGLLHSRTREVARGIPVLRSIPVLGKIFGSKDYLNEKSELVLVLIPLKRKPRINTKELETYFPRGPMPALREWIQPDDLAVIRSHPNFPWNVLK